MAAPLRAILFDLDGTLLDTAPEMVDALNAVRVEQGLAPLAFEEARSSVSHGSTRLIHLGFPDANPQRFAALQSRFLDIYAEGLGLRHATVRRHGLGARGAVPSRLEFGNRHQQTGLAHRPAAGAARSAPAFRLRGERRYR